MCKNRALSGGRPGVRRDSVQNYIKRLEALESVANSFEGVERSFAIQATAANTLSPRDTRNQMSRDIGCFPLVLSVPTQSSAAERGCPCKTERNSGRAI